MKLIQYAKKIYSNWLTEMGQNKILPLHKLQVGT